MRFLGTQYRWGGRSVSGLDCSGLASLTYMLAGVNIFRDAKPAPGYPIRPLSMGERLRTGDLLYFPGHVAMYIGDGRREQVQTAWSSTASTKSTSGSGLIFTKAFMP